MSYLDAVLYVLHDVVQRWSQVPHVHSETETRSNQGHSRRNNGEERSEDGQNIVDEETARHGGACKSPKADNDAHQDDEGDVDVPYRLGKARLVVEVVLCQLLRRWRETEVPRLTKPSISHT